MRTKPALVPSSAAKALAHRVTMLRARSRLRRVPDGAERALAVALRDAAVGRIPAEEREWLRRIEARRAELIHAGETRPPAELGVFDLAGAVRWISVPPVLGAFLVRLVRELAPRSCLEVGTGLGLSAAYQGAALTLNGRGTMTSIDVSDAHAAHARAGLEELGIVAVDVRVGDGKSVLAAALAERERLDYVFVDADHQEEPTIACFEAVLPRLAPGALVLLDDVGFGIPEMARAWERIGRYDEVRRTIPIGRFGAVLT